MGSSNPSPGERTLLAGGAVMTTLRGGAGPTLTVMGGIHGDEDEGVLAVHQLLHRLRGLPLAGTLRAVAPASPAAWAVHSRTSPLDGENLARSFPGDPQGGPTSVLAASITEQAIDGADLLIDLHSAGVRYSMPLFTGFTVDFDAVEVSRCAAVAFGTPLIWEHHGLAPGRSLTAAHELGIPAIYAECPGGGRVRAEDLDAYVTGVLSVMAEIGMVDPSFRLGALTDPRYVYGGGDLDTSAQATRPGLFVTGLEAGEVVKEGGEIGWMYDYEGCLIEEVRAPFGGMVMFLRRHARVQTGDVLFALAKLEGGTP